MHKITIAKTRKKNIYQVTLQTDGLQMRQIQVGVTCLGGAMTQGLRELGLNEKDCKIVFSDLGGIENDD